jgi:hypothetical protein
MLAAGEVRNFTGIFAAFGAASPLVTKTRPKSARIRGRSNSGFQNKTCAHAHNGPVLVRVVATRKSFRLAIRLGCRAARPTPIFCL